jgi:acetylornithine/succinyldiaminopimelate/putrescine aminotransferase
MNAIEQLRIIRSKVGTALTSGLSDEQIQRFLALDPNLQYAIKEAVKAFLDLEDRQPDLLKLPEAELMQVLNQSVQGFYDPVDASPYVPLAAKGSWIITAYGAVVYETGGYGMLGFGHNPDFAIQALAREQVMANVMTRSVLQYDFTNLLKSKIGFTRPDLSCPYSKFLFMNSGSESMEVAGRLVDINTKRMTDAGAKFAGRKVVSIAMIQGFHGRTTLPARVSDSSRKKYQSALASFRESDNLVTVEPNNLAHLASTYQSVLDSGCFIDALYMEPVMGEGNPGLAISPDFFALARKLTEESGALLVVDSIQAGLRAWGVLSIVDYPGFGTLSAPDMESYSKAVNAGQYPLSVLAMRPATADLYQYGVYGNTMTGTPRALEVGMAVLAQCDQAFRENVVARGYEFSEKLKSLIAKYPGHLVSAQGTGLLVSLELNSKIPVTGKDGIELKLRKKGLQVIHGGKNSLRFTPSFLISSAEIDLILQLVEQELSQFEI